MRRWQRVWAAVLVVWAVLLAAGWIVFLTSVRADAAELGYVVDGDTIRLESGAYVRMIGIDTPEEGQCGHDVAEKALDALLEGTIRLPNPKAVEDKDHYGRLLRYVEDGGRDAGLWLIRHGFADARYDGRDGYGWHPRQKVYRRADANHKDVC